MNEQVNESEQSAAPETNTTTAPVPASKPAKAKKAKAKTAVKKSAAKAEKKAKKSAGKKGTAKGPGALRQYAPEYHKDNEKKTAGGNTSVDSDDDVAKKLRGKSIDEVYAMCAKTCDIPEKDLRAKYKGLNLGMQRMNLGNRIRGVLHAK